MIFEKCRLKGRLLKNHIVFPAVVCFGWSAHGEMSERRLEHYRKVAKGGAGLIISEASAVNPEAMLTESQPGIWSDSFIEGYEKLAGICHAEGVPVTVQINHAGIKSVTGEPLVPGPVSSDISGRAKRAGGRARELASSEITAIEDQFAAAALRLKKAGIDGVELHGAHGFLLSYFLSPVTNKRGDEYGGSAENRARIVTDIIKKIRAGCGGEFIIGIRYGGATPSLEDGAVLAKLFEDSGCDILDISTGALGEAVPVPEKYVEFNSCVYTAIEIKKRVSIPVIASNSVGTIEKGKILVDGGLTDFAAYARNILADYDWVKKTEQGKESARCLHCRSCRWFTRAFDDCPARKREQRRAAASGN
ncbi:MAG: NADH:flavin oxidoreductase [Treponema sp.]|jgi:2,4-dienoyl-CoA reductase-like NADH-dependent reductase (Old Yellow Enzyme family)|nr:NADH:flavin oxidoreductase [Treponema sp.]